MLAVAIVAMVLFWIRWPSMTASSFVADPRIGPQRVIVDFDSLEDQMERIHCFYSDKQNLSASLFAVDRTFMDVLVGEQHFEYGMYEITVRRGKVAVYGPFYNFGFGKFRR